MTYRFKIQIRGLRKPTVWRIVTVPGDFTFHKFHQVIQAAFGWLDYHLYEFRPTEEDVTRVAIPDEEFGVPAIDSREVPIEAYFHKKGDSMVYTYDFGDNWVHDIKLMAVIQNKHKRAHCESGQGLCPPEDVGGPHGYAMLKKAFEESPFNNMYRDWLGMEPYHYFDPDYFSRTEAESYIKDACNGTYGLSEPDD